MGKSILREKRFSSVSLDVFRHLLYTQVEKCLPANLPHAQMSFFRVVSRLNELEYHIFQIFSL